MPKQRIKKKWYMPNGWHTPRGIYRRCKDMEKEIEKQHRKKEVSDIINKKELPFNLTYKKL